MKGLWTVITGPSGAGKTVLAEAILREVPRSGKILTCTTRPARPGEVQGETYRFLHDDEFDLLLEQKEFVEWEPVHIYRYGSLKKDLESALERFSVVVSVVDPKGARTIAERYPEARTVFVTAPKNELIRRLKKRGEKPEEIAVRMHSRDKEMLLAREFDLILLNKNLTETTNKLLRQIAQWRAHMETCHN